MIYKNDQSFALLDMIYEVFLVMKKVMIGISHYFFRYNPTLTENIND